MKFTEKPEGYKGPRPIEFDRYKGGWNKGEFDDSLRPPLPGRRRTKESKGRRRPQAGIKPFGPSRSDV